MNRLEEIRKEVIAKLEAIFQEQDVSLEEIDVVKLNDIYQYGISFTNGEVGKTLYINDFAAENKTAQDIADEMLVAYENSVDAPPWMLIKDLKSSQNLTDLKEHLFVALLEISRNKEYLKEIPFQETGHGFAYIVQIRHTDSSGNGFMSTAVTNKLMESNSWDKEELFSMAIENSLKNNEPVLYTMEEAMFGEPKNLLDTKCHEMAVMYILTNAAGTLGSASMFLPGTIARIHAFLKGGFYAIPSSIHEWLIVPESDEINCDSLTAMCKDANKTVVEAKEILSDHVLHFPVK